jgi:WD40 repeat protein
MTPRFYWWLLFLFGVVDGLERSNSYGAVVQNDGDEIDFQLVVTTSAPLTTLVFSPDPRTLLAATQAGLICWSWPTLESIETIDSRIEMIQDLRFSPNGQRLAIAGGIPGEVGQIEIWDWTEKVLLKSIEVHHDSVMQVAWSSDEQYVATASFDGSCGVWNVVTGAFVARFQGHSKPVLTLCYWSGDQLLSAGIDQSIRGWNGLDGAEHRSLVNHVGTVRVVLPQLHFTTLRSRRLISIGEDKTVRLWQPEIGRLIRFQRMPSVPSAGAWALGTEVVLVGCENGVLYRLQSDSLEVVGEGDTKVGIVHAIVVHPTTGQIAVAGQKGLSMERSEPIDSKDAN